MNKIIALNWKNTQTAESAPALLKTTGDVVNIYPDYSWIVFPGDNLINSLTTNLPLGLQTVDPLSPLPYCLIGHMSHRLNGKTDEEIQSEIESLENTSVVPFFCVGPLQQEDTLKGVMVEQLTALENWPKNKRIIISYEPGYAIGNGKTMTLEDIEIIYDILYKALLEFTNKSIIYGGSVNDTNIVHILEITDGVIIGTASQKSSSLLALSIALGQE